MPARRKTLTPEAEGRRLLTDWDALHRRPPRVLYHYTTAEGLLGMLQTGTLWATHVRFMNDTSEMAYGVQLVRDELAACSERVAREDRKLAPTFEEYVGSVEALLEHSRTETKHYIVCFCSNGNLLSQWRGYGAQGGGYAPGFLSSRLGHFAAQFLPESGCSPESLPVVLRRVVYDPRVQQAVVRRCLKALVEAATFDRRHSKLHEQRGISPHLARTLYECLVCFKHPGFSEEKEWRLIQQGRVGNTDVCPQEFRARSGRIVSFTTLRYQATRPDGRPARASDRPFPISTITYGPTLDAEASERALRLLLERHGFAARQVAIRPSGIPFSG